MSHFYVFVLLLVCSVSTRAADPFDELDNEIERFHKEESPPVAQQDDFQHYLTQQENEYAVWQQSYLREFDAFQKGVIEKWGKVEPLSAESYVAFSEDKNIKSIINYQQNKVKFELLIDKKLSQAEAKAEMDKKIGELLASKASTISSLLDDIYLDPAGEVQFYDVEYSASNQQQSKSNIIKQTEAQAQEIDKQADRAQLAGSFLTEEESLLLANQEKLNLLKSSQLRLTESEISYQEAQQKAPNDKQVISYTVTLPANALQKRAKKYVAFVQQESEKQQIAAPLIMAIMHSESAFNPNAKSAVPAYGLMQIVPSTAGHDVNRIVRNIDRPMSSDDLYVPAINIETGSAYLNILDTRYLKAIKNERSRLYCTIAAYNTGAGNVAKAFNEDGSRNIHKASKKINQLSADEVYQQLLSRLPYDETKHYLQRVNDRIKLYQTEL